MKTDFVTGKELSKRYEKHEIMEMIKDERLIPYSPAFRKSYTTMVSLSLLRKWKEFPPDPLKELLLPDFGLLYPHLDEILFNRRQIELLDRPKKGKRDGERESTQHRDACRKEAKRLWDVKAEKGKTIADMIRHLQKVYPVEANYEDRTVREWINDLCPNRKAGRRPKIIK